MNLNMRVMIFEISGGKAFGQRRTAQESQLDEINKVGSYINIRSKCSSIDYDDCYGD